MKRILNVSVCVLIISSLLATSVAAYSYDISTSGFHSNPIIKETDERNNAIPGQVYGHIQARFNTDLNFRYAGFFGGPPTDEVTFSGESKGSFKPPTYRNDPNSWRLEYLQNMTLTDTWTITGDEPQYKLLIDLWPKGSVIDIGSGVLYKREFDSATMWKSTTLNTSDLVEGANYSVNNGVYTYFYERGYGNKEFVSRGRISNFSQETKFEVTTARGSFSATAIHTCTFTRPYIDAVECAEGNQTASVDGPEPPS